MSSMAATDSVFASKESGVTAVPDQEAADHSGLLQVLLIYCLHLKCEDFFFKFQSADEV